MLGLFHARWTGRGQLSDLRGGIEVAPLLVVRWWPIPQTGIGPGSVIRCLPAILEVPSAGPSRSDSAEGRPPRV
jgi:hypothetical protein